MDAEEFAACITAAVETGLEQGIEIGRRLGSAEAPTTPDRRVSSQAGLDSILRGLAATNSPFGPPSGGVEIKVIEVIPHTRPDCNDPEKCPVHYEGSPWSHDFDFLEREAPVPDGEAAGSGDNDPTSSDEEARDTDTYDGNRDFDPKAV